MAGRDSLEKLSKKLDAGKAEGGGRRSPLFPHSSEAPSAWRDASFLSSTALSLSRKRRLSSLSILFIGSAIFFFVAVASAALLFFSGSNVVSTKNVDIEIAGPAAIGAGETLSLQVVVTNRNTVPMQLTDLVVEFPPNTRLASDVSVELPRIRESLGTIEPGESVNRTVKAVLFGAAGADASISVSVEYRVPSSNAIFVAAATYTARLSQSPATIVVNAESEVVSGQSTALTVAVTSNSPQVLTDVLLLLLYPPGFALERATPAPVSGGTVFSLGDIEPGGTRSVTIIGTVTGEDGDARVTTFTVGTRKAGGVSDITAPLAALQHEFIVTKPFIAARIALQGLTADQHTILRGRAIEGQIYWTNNLPVSVQDLSLTLSLQGQSIDAASVRASQGFYSSANSSILWDKSTEVDLAQVAPGRSGTFGFSFATLPVGQGSFKNPALDLTLTVRANRAGEGNVPEAIEASARTKALVATDLALTTRLSHVGDAGPVPPQANVETEYTVSWSVTNSANSLAQTAVTAVLPSYVRHIGAVSPGSETVSFNEGQRIVSWNIGEMSAGASRAVFFKVGVTPSLSQVGQAPVVVGSQRAAGFDRFVQDGVESSAPELTTASAVSSQSEGLVVP